jgi:hypothetical protein
MAKVSYEMDSNLDSVLSWLAGKQKISPAKMVRRSVALMKFLDDEIQRGNRVAITDSQGVILREILFPQTSSGAL